MSVRRAAPALALAFALAGTVPPAHAQRDTRRSGFDDMSPALQAMQREDAQNPAMLWKADGEALWKRREGPAGRSCEDCHGAAAASMRGVAARYPAFDERLGRPVDLETRIGLCRERRQQAPGWAADADPLLALATFVAWQSRGLPIAPPSEPRLAPFVAEGERLFRQRIGQLDLACDQCHDARAGRHLGSATIPQAHPTGYPIYRLEWQSMGSLARRIRGCMTGVRAEPYPFGAPELASLAAYLATRAAGLAVDAPAVRP
jgi:L-cysteine S-thiosulfotransferase